MHVSAPRGACTLRRGKSLSERPRCAKILRCSAVPDIPCALRSAEQYRCPVRECQQTCRVCVALPLLFTRSVSNGQKASGSRSPVPRVRAVLRASHPIPSHSDSATAIPYPPAAVETPPPLIPWDVASERVLRYAQYAKRKHYFFLGSCCIQYAVNQYHRVACCKLTGTVYGFQKNVGSN